MRAYISGVMSVSSCVGMCALVCVFVPVCVFRMCVVHLMFGLLGASGKGRARG